MHVFIKSSGNPPVGCLTKVGTDSQTGAISRAAGHTVFICLYISGLISLSFLQEWLDLRCRGVRNANAYILVYDICCVESFEYVKMIRQQIVEHRYSQPDTLSWTNSYRTYSTSTDIEARFLMTNPISPTGRRHAISQAWHIKLNNSTFMTAWQWWIVCL